MTSYGREERVFKNLLENDIIPDRINADNKEKKSTGRKKRVR